MADQCKQDRARFKASSELARALANSLPKGSEQREAIEKALKAIGTEGDHNGVSVTFGKTGTGGPMERSGSHITVDWGVFDKGVQMYKDAGYKPDPTVAAAAEIAHEGTHLSQPSRSESFTYDSLN